MNNVLDVANYIIHFFNKKNQPITQLKLQKLLYFVQVNFLMNLNESINTVNNIENSCFSENIIALPYGPVVEEVLNEYRGYGRENLKFKTFENIKRVDLIESVCNTFLITPAPELVEKTHRQYPWINAYNRGVGTIITRESIFEYFSIFRRN